MIVDFSLILVVATLLTGVIWALDVLFLLPGRKRALAGGAAPESVREPVAVEYARSFFPVIFVVLLIRSFLFEPFRIPSDSMMPTLLDGDFIFVSKFAYGLKLPVTNTKFLPIGEPHRGDVIVFRKPSDPSMNYIKRLVGLPGDHIEVRGRQVYVNDKPMAVEMHGRYQGPRNIEAQADADLGEELLGDIKHRILYITAREPREYDELCRLATISSWATIVITVATAATPTWASSRRRIWWARQCGSGSTGTCRSRRCGDASAMRFVSQ